jgi:S1-C subfamily serine protease
VNPAGPAGAAGIVGGDVIIKIDTVEVFGLHELLMLEDALVPGQQVSITINRAGHEFEIQIITSQRPWPWG